MARAAAVQAQLAGDDVAACMPAQMSWAATAIDPALSRRALARVTASVGVDRSFADSAQPLEAFDLERALGVVWQTAEGDRGWLFVEAALASGSPPEPVVRHVGRILLEQSRTWLATVCPELLIEIWQLPSLRDPLCTALFNADLDPCGPLWTRIENAARSDARKRSIAGLFDRLVGARAAADRARFLAHTAAPMVRRAIMATRRSADAKAWLNAYRALPDLASAAIALADLESAWRTGGPAMTSPDPEQLATASAAASWTIGVQPSTKSWLETALATERARTTAETAKATSPREVLRAEAPKSQRVEQLLLPFGA
jgi:hypothetical protein